MQRITIAGKRREMGLGSPPIITLAMAREKAIENKRMALAGNDPIAARRRRVEVMTFARAVELYLSGKVDDFRNDKHRKQWRATLDTYAVPVIGAMLIDSIESRDVPRILPVASRKVIGLFLEQFRFEFVPALQRLQGRLAAQG